MLIRLTILASLCAGPATTAFLHQKIQKIIAPFRPLARAQIGRNLHRLEKEGLVRWGEAPRSASCQAMLTHAGHQTLENWLRLPTLPTEQPDPRSARLGFCRQNQPTQLYQKILNRDRLALQRRQELLRAQRPTTHAPREEWLVRELALRFYEIDIAWLLALESATRENTQLPRSGEKIAKP